MAQAKFEEHIREKLDERRLQPSNTSWDKLSDRLESDEKRNNKNMYWWYGIAATIVGILFAVTQLMNNEALDTIKSKVVENPNTIEKVKADELQNEVTSGVKQSVEVIVTTQKKEVLETLVEKERPQQKTLPDIKESTLAVAKNIDVPQESEVAMDSIKIIEELTFKEQKIQQVVAQVKELQKSSHEVTDKDIEKLLQEAQREIALKQLYNESTGVVDANTLLQDVEEDLDRSFRTKVFDALKASYGTVKSAVVSRNN